MSSSLPKASHALKWGFGKCPDTGYAAHQWTSPLEIYGRCGEEMGLVAMGHQEVAWICLFPGKNTPRPHPKHPPPSGPLLRAHPAAELTMDGPMVRMAPRIQPPSKAHEDVEGRCRAEPRLPKASVSRRPLDSSLLHSVVAQGFVIPSWLHSAHTFTNCPSPHTCKPRHHWPCRCFC